MVASIMKKSKYIAGWQLNKYDNVIKEWGEGKANPK